MNKCKELKCSYCCEVIEIQTFNKEMDYWKMRTEVKDGKAVIRLPCPNLKGGECLIYDKRPNTCRNYECKKLQEKNRGKLIKGVIVDGQGRIKGGNF